MASLEQQLSQVVVSIFQTSGAPASASETASHLQLVQSAFSDLNDLFDEALWKTSNATNRDLQIRWRTLRTNHIRTLEHVLSQRQQQASSKNPKKPPVPSQQPSEIECQECGLKQETIESLRDKVEGLNAEIEQHKMLKAAGLVTAGALKDAETVYKALEAIRDIELKRRQKIGKGAFSSERAGLKIKAELAAVLAKQQNFYEAEKLSRHVLTRRRALLRVNHEEIRLAQRQLCEIFRSQLTHSKYMEADALYRAVWNTYNGKSKLSGSDTDTWILENGRNLATVLREDGDNDAALAQLQKVLKASATMNKESQASALQLVKWYLDLKQATEAAKTIQDYFISSTEPWTSETLRSAAKVAKALAKQGDNASAESIWKRMLEELHKKSGPNTADALNAAWQLALAQYKLKSYDTAKKTLHDLLRARAGESAKSEDIVGINALLAACCSKVNDEPMAEKHARLVWKERENEDVLGLGAAYCAGVILVRAVFSPRRGKSDRDEGRKIWTRMLTKKKEEVAAGTCTGKQLQDTKTAWLKLAADVLAHAKRRGLRESYLEKDIRRAVGAL